MTVKRGPDNDSCGSGMDGRAEGTSSRASKAKDVFLRSRFRIPLVAEDSIRVMIDTEMLPVLNFSEAGLQVLLQGDDQFQVGQCIDQIELFFSNSSLNVKGKVMYVDKIDCGKYAMGLQLTFLDDASQEFFKKYYMKKRSKMFNQQDALDGL